ncbi:MAG: AAA family ATPase [Candidatus Brocadiae bacterium]|nr:AAA family ATPase [Candidatus Brocadiia bacterium]
MRLREISIPRYRSISTGTITLRDLTTLVGSNGSGKSSVLRAIQFLCCGASQGEVQLTNGRPALAQLLCQRGAPEVHGVLEVEEADVSALNDDLKLTLGGDRGWSGGTFRISRTYVPSSQPTRPMQVQFTPEQQAWLGAHATKLSAVLENRIATFATLIPAERTLGSTDYQAGVPYLRDGSTLLRKLHAHSVERTQSLSDVVDVLERQFHSVFPEFNNLRVVQRNGLYDIEVNKKEKFNSAWLGSGHREILVMLGEILFSTGIVMIEEPERGLHPKLQREILPILERAAAGRQLIVCTHSPAVISAA